MREEGFIWNVTPEQAWGDAMNVYVANVKSALRLLCLRYAAEIETWMKVNAPWTDRTGNLRKSLYAQVEDLANEIVLGFDYGLDYGKHLEFAHQGRYAIIAPAFDQFLGRFAQDIGRLLS